MIATKTPYLKLKFLVGRCREVRVREDKMFGFDLRFYRPKGVYPPANAISDFKQNAGWNHVMPGLFVYQEDAQEMADRINEEIEEWCKIKRKEDKITDDLYKGHLAIFPPQR